MEAAGLGSASGLSTGDHHPVKSGEPCANCETVVEDRFCTTCGQLASDFHRPIWDLVMSSLADVFALDGRLWRSLPMLLFRPGRMTRNYLDGKRARYVPPFRMFLMASVIFFLTLFTLGEQMGWYSAEGGIALRRILQEDGRINRDALYEEVTSRLDEGATQAEREQAWRTADHAATVYENQDRYGARMREWAPRFSLMFMPILALVLTLLYAWHRSRYIYDHVVTALHVQTYIYLMMTVMLVIAAINPASIGWLVLIGNMLVVAYIYRQLRVTYGTGRFMAALRTFIVLVTSFLVLVSLAAILIIVSFMLV